MPQYTSVKTVSELECVKDGDSVERRSEEGCSATANATKKKTRSDYTNLLNEVQN